MSAGWYGYSLNTARRVRRMSFLSGKRSECCECHLDKRLEESEKEKVAVPTVSEFQQEPGYASDAELLAAAEQVLDESEVPVSTLLTKWGALTPAVTQESANRPFIHS